MTPELLAALKVLLSEHLGDWIYEVRARAAESHPRVIAISNAVFTIEKAVKEAEQA